MEKKGCSTGDQRIVEQDDNSDFACFSGNYKGVVSQKEAALERKSVLQDKKCGTFSDIYD